MELSDLLAEPRARNTYQNGNTFLSSFDSNSLLANLHAVYVPDVLPVKYLTWEPHRRRLVNGSLAGNMFSVCCLLLLQCSSLAKQSNTSKSERRQLSLALNTNDRPSCLEEPKLPIHRQFRAPETLRQVASHSTERSGATHTHTYELHKYRFHHSNLLFVQALPLHSHALEPGLRSIKETMWRVST